MKKQIDDSWIYRPGVDRIEDFYDARADDLSEDEKPSVWPAIGAISPSDPNYWSEFFRSAEKALASLKAQLAQFPKSIRKQDVGRALSDPGWLDQDRIQQRAENRERVARQRARARTADPEGFRRSERERRARHREAQRRRMAGGVSPLFPVRAEIYPLTTPARGLPVSFSKAPPIRGLSRQGR